MKYSCICGAADAERVKKHGLTMLRCACGVLRQDVKLSEEELAEWYRTRYHDGTYCHTYEHDAQVARQRLAAYGISRGAVLLDVGCGNGAFVNEAIAQGIDAWGQDLAEQPAGPRIYAGDLEALCFPAARFDVVTAHDVLEHVPSPRAFLREIARILRPGGRLLVDFPRFHDPSGRHHWKAIEHLWMLTEEQLAELLRSEGFGADPHPIPSKTVLEVSNHNGARPARILVPPGIGDGYWVLTKLRGFIEARGLELPEVWVHDGGGPRRSGDFWAAVPFVRFGGYAQEPKPGAWTEVSRRAYLLADYPVQRNVPGGFDWFLSFNGCVDHGRSLDEAMPGPTEWYPPLFKTKDREAATASYRERWGSYVVVAFWDHSFYLKWLAEFSEAQIVSTLRRLADRGLTVVVSGAEWDKAGIATRLAGADRRFVNLVGQTSFTELAALLEGAAGVFGHPAGSTLLGPFFRRPTLLLWHEHFPRAMWRNVVPPDAAYQAVWTRNANPAELADRLVGMMGVGTKLVVPAAKPRASSSATSAFSGSVLPDRHPTQLSIGHAEARSAFVGAALLPQTLGVSVPDVPQAVRALGSPDAESEPGSTAGPLQWWAVTLACGDRSIPGFVLRHERSRTAFLELMAESFDGFAAGAAVTVTRRDHAFAERAA